MRFFSCLASVAATAAAVAAGCKARDTAGTLAAANTAYAQPSSRTVAFAVPTTIKECEDKTLEGRAINAPATPEDLYIDGLCSELFMKKYDPYGNGVVSVFGSSALKEGHISYLATRQLASAWAAYQATDAVRRDTKRVVPLITAAGPGVMEAANCGAVDAPTAATDTERTARRKMVEARSKQNQLRSASLGYGTTFGVPPTLSNRFKSGSKAWEFNDCITSGYIFRSFALRESEMIDRARISVVEPGGLGTEWEIFEILSKIQTGKAPNNGGKKPPLVILYEGDLSDDQLTTLASAPTPQAAALQRENIENYWKTFKERMQAFLAAGTIKPDHLKLFKCAQSIDEAMTLMKAEVEGTTPAADVGRCEGLDP